MESIALLTPPYPKFGFKMGEALGIRYIASFLRQHGFKADVFEPAIYEWDEEKTVKTLLKNDYDVIGFSTTSFLFENVLKVVKKLREKGYDGLIILGGHFATFECEKILKKCKIIDGVVLYEGEIPTLKLMQNDFSYLATEENPNPKTAFVEDLDDLPFPYREDLKRLKKDHYTISSGRGCYGNCSFCSVNAFYKKKIRLRSAKNVVDEIELLVNEFKAKAISFVDDNFIMGSHGKKRAIRIAEELKKRQIEVKFIVSARPNDVSVEVLKPLKDVGLVGVEIGFESANDSQLKRYNKGVNVRTLERALKVLNDLNLRVFPFFIPFDPYVSLQELKTNYGFMVKHGLVSYKNLSNKLYPYPGTQAFCDLKYKGLLRENGWDYDYDFVNAEIKGIYEKIKKAESLKVLDFIRDVLTYRCDVYNECYKDEIKLIDDYLKDFTKRFFCLKFEEVESYADELAKNVLSWNISKRIIKMFLK